MARVVPVELRFWNYVRKSSGCWLWIGSIRDGYGRITVTANGKKRSREAHRVSWELHNGPLPTDHRICVCHHCDVKNCVNPEHLFLGSDQDNLDDSYAKGIRKRDGLPNKPTRFTPERVREIRAAWIPYKVSVRALSERFNTSRTNIERILTRKIYQYVD